MANTKKYSIVINGVNESVSAVDELIAKLNKLEQKINEISSKASIKINATTSASVIDKSGNKVLKEQDALQRQILATEEKLAQVRDDNYQKLLHLKEELKEYTQVAKSAAAATENKQGLFDTNTLLGMKEALKSIKTEMQTLDVGSERFQELTQKANELNKKLKQIEQSYGQYGRNVGNYANGVADGLKKAEQNSTTLKVTIGGVTREFSNAREASRTLGNELKTMAVLGKQNTKEYKELEKTFKSMQSTLKDVGKSSVAMDNILDAAQSVTAMASAGQGFATVFGIDDTELNKSIQKLLALQTALNGLNTLMNQMKTGEFMGGIFDKVKNFFSFSSSDKDIEDTSNLQNILEGAADASDDVTRAMDKSKEAIEGVGGATNATAAGLNKIGDAGNTAAAGIGNVTTNSMGAAQSFTELGKAMAKPQVEAAKIQSELSMVDSELNILKAHLLEIEIESDKLRSKRLFGNVTREEIVEIDNQLKGLTADYQLYSNRIKELLAERERLLAQFNMLISETETETAAVNKNSAAVEKNAKAHQESVSSTDRAASSTERNAAATEKEATAANNAAAANEKLATTTNKVSTANGKTTTSFGGMISGFKNGIATMFSFANVVKFLGSTLKMIGSMALWGAIIWGMTEVVSWISKWIKGNSDLIKSEDLVKNQMEQVNEKLKERLELNKALDTGQMGGKYLVMAADEKAYGEAIKETNKLLEQKIKLQNEDLKIGAKPLTSSIFGDSNRGIFGEGINGVEEFVNRYNALSEAIEKNTKFVYKNAEGLTIASAKTNKAKEQLLSYQQAILGDYVYAMKYFDTSTREGALALDAFIKENDRLTNGIYSSALANMGNIVKDAGLKEALEQSKAQINNFLTFIRNSNQQVEQNLKNLIKGGLDVANKDNADYWIKQIDEKYDTVIQAVKDSGRELTFEEIRQLEQGRKAEKEQVKKSINSRLTSERNKYKKLGKEQQKLDDEFAQLRVKAMQEGLEKELAQIEANKKKELAKWKGNAEAIKLITIVYDREILNAKKKWAKDIRDVYQGLADDIYKIMQDVNKRNLDISTSTTERNAATAKDNAYAENIDLGNPDDIERTRKYSSEIVKIEIETNNKLAKLNEERIQNEYDTAVREEEIRHRNVLDLEAQESVMSEVKKRTNEDGSFIPQDDAAAWKEFEENLKERLKSANGKLADAYNSGKISFQQFITLTMQEQKAFNAKMNVLEEQRKNDSENNTKETNDRNYQSNAEYYDKVLDAAKNSQEEIEKVLEKGEKASRNNAFQIINLGQYTKTINTAKQKYTELRGELVQEKDKLRKDLAENKITPQDFTIKDKELDNQIDDIDNKLSELNEKSKDKIGEFIRDISQYVNAIGQSLQQVLQAVWDNQDAEYDKAMEALEKQIDEYEKLMDRQQEIAESHKNAIEGIEDELSTARGDRRQQLIDNLNAEMAAQRAALAQEKKAEKEKERLEKKKEEEEAKQRKKEHQRAVIQAIISAALATVNGLATPPFMPMGIAMGALAAAAGAVQVALIKSQKYASGGIIEGKPHSQGGVKVLGGRAEVEGGEYITNKVTTQKNVDLLYYINSKKRRIDLDDMIEFYSGKKVRKNISSVSSTRFADGGQIPTLNTNISTNNLTAAFAEYANRPSVVSVVEIMDKTQRVNQVRTLAGYAD